MDLLEIPLSSLLTELQRFLSTLSTVLSNHVGLSSVDSLHPSIPSVQPPAPLMPHPQLNTLPSHPSPSLPLPAKNISHPAPSSLHPQPGSVVPPIPGSRPLFTDVIRQSILSQPASLPQPRRPIISRNRAFSKLQHLRALAKSGMAICYKCGESGHLTEACRNSLVCFLCKQTGHRSSSCRNRPAPPPIPPLAPLLVITSTPLELSSQPVLPPPFTPVSITLVPPPSQARLLEANTLHVMRYYATPASSRFLSTLISRFGLDGCSSSRTAFDSR